MPSEAIMRQRQLDGYQQEVIALQKTVENANMREARATNNTERKAAKQAKNNAMSRLQTLMVASALLRMPHTSVPSSRPSASGHTYNIRPEYVRPQYAGGRRRSHKKAHKKRRSTRRR